MKIKTFTRKQNRISLPQLNEHMWLGIHISVYFLTVEAFGIDDSLTTIKQLRGGKKTRVYKNRTKGDL